jgi:hypothetical protein
MADGAWDQTALLRAEIRAPWSKKRVNAMDLHPFKRRQKKRQRVKPHPDGVKILTEALCGSHNWARK